MPKAVTFAAWLWIAGAALSIGFASPHRASAPLKSNPAEVRLESPLDIKFRDEAFVPSEEDSVPDSSCSSTVEEAPVRLPVPVISRRQALMRMYECLKAADRSFEGKLAEFAELEDSLILEEDNYYREAWRLPLTGSLSMSVDAESGALLHLYRFELQSEAPKNVSPSQAEGIARKYLDTAYPEFHSRPFRLEAIFNQGDSLKVCFGEDHGADVGQFRNWIMVDVDAANGGIAIYRATYIRVETDPILCSADMAKSRALEYLFPADDPPPGQFSKFEIETFVEPVSRSRAKASWNVSFGYPDTDGIEDRRWLRRVEVDCSTGEIRVRLSKMD